MSTVGQATVGHDRVHCAAQKCSCPIHFFGYSGVGQPCRHARGRTQITRSVAVEEVMPQPSLLTIRRILAR
jgi:hypothetical protein